MIFFYRIQIKINFSNITFNYTKTDHFVNQVQESKVTFANNTPQCVDKISKLIMIWSKNMDLHQSIADLL